MATFELAIQGRHGEWEHCGDFATRDEAIRDAERLALAGYGHVDDGGGRVFGLSSDPASGHYETLLSIWIEQGRAVVVDSPR